MKVTRKILLLILMLALAVCVLAVTTFAADETTNAEDSVTPAYASYEFPADKSSTDYPLAVFGDNGDGTYTFVNLYTNWTAAIKAAYAKSKAVIYFRSDVTTGADDNANNVFINGHTTSITVDLNDKTLYRQNAAYLIQALNQAAKTDVDVTFKNGTLANTSTSWRGFFQYAYDSGHTVQDAYVDYMFDNVTVYDKRADTVTNKDLIFSYAGSGGTKQTYGTVVFNDCKIYPASGNIRSIFDTQSNSSIDMTFIVNGGKIETSLDIALDKYIRTTNGDVLIFGQSENGYTQFVYTNGATSSGTITVTDETGAKRVLTQYTQDGTTTVYSLTASETTTTETTDYGNINYTSAQASASYPLAVFVKNGSSYALRGLYNNWRDSILGAASYEEAVIYFRDNVTNGSTNDIYLNGRKSSIIIDLNNKTLYKKDAAYIIMTLSQSAITDVDITFKNGSIVHQSTSWRGFFQLAADSSHTAQTAYVDYTFDNVKFIDERTANHRGNDLGNDFIFSMGGSGATKETISTAKLNNCELSVAKDVNYIFNFQNSTKINVALAMNGGRILSDTDITMSKLVRVNSGSDSVTFGNYNGQYTEFVYPNSVTISNTVNVTDDFGNTRVLAKKSNDDTNTTYELAEKTPYGLLTGLTAAQTADKAPLAVFEDKGNNTYARIALYSGADWNEAAKAAYAKTKAVIYFRADVTPNNDNDVFINGRTTSITVDMNGNTLYKKNEAYLIQALSQTAKTDVEVTFKNGSMVHCCTSSRAWRGFFQLAADSTHTAQTAYVDYTFENVKFVDNRTSTNLHFIFSMGGSGATQETVGIVAFNNCELSPSKGVNNIFDFKDSNKINVALNVNGCKIISNKSLTTAESIFKKDTSGDYIKFGKYDGKYTTTQLASGATMDTASVWNTSDGAECVFVNVPGTTTYTLYPSVMLGYKIKSSVTLYSNFVYNIYVPVTDAVSCVYIDGEAVSLDDGMITVIDESEYYRIQISLPASKSLNDIKVVVSLASGETTVNAKWILNVVNYAKTVIAGDSSDVEKALVRDMLSYAASAHTYFKTTEDVIDKLSEIANILGENYDENNKVTVSEDAAKQPADDTYFTSVAIYLGEVPSFRFYLASGYEASDFSFTVGGRKVSAIPVDENNDGTADCVEIVMYAYMMLDDVGYTVVNKDTKASVTEYYNLYAYYKYVTSLTGDNVDANLVSIVERLMKYAASAEAYRESVVNPTTES